MICVIVDHFIAFPPTQACSCLVLYLEFLAIQQLFFFTLEYYHLYIGIVIGIAHHPMNSWYSDTSCHHCSFLGPRVDATGIPTNEL